MHANQGIEFLCEVTQELLQANASPELLDLGISTHWSLYRSAKNSLRGTRSSLLDTNLGQSRHRLSFPQAAPYISQDRPREDQQLRLIHTPNPSTCLPALVQEKSLDEMATESHCFLNMRTTRRFNGRPIRRCTPIKCSEPYLRDSCHPLSRQLSI